MNAILGTDAVWDYLTIILVTAMLVGLAGHWITARKVVKLAEDESYRFIRLAEIKAGQDFLGEGGYTQSTNGTVSTDGIVSLIDHPARG